MCNYAFHLTFLQIHVRFPQTYPQAHGIVSTFSFFARDKSLRTPYTVRVRGPHVTNIPNIISVGRILIVPVLVFFLASIQPDKVDAEKWNILASAIAGALYIVGAASDILDGFLARRYSTETVFGKLFDPLADKVLSLGTLIMLIPLGRISAWLVVLLLTREILVTTLRGIATQDGVVISASKWGKMKSAFLNSGAAGLALYYPFLGIEWFYCGWVMLWIGTGLSLLSGFHYTADFLKQVYRERPQHS